ncbi:MAG: hypothetical protein HC836_44225 [Richelia sp. RM2_1_2]|nr:hypothetical protein [Richelia sp. RM2_1_2]
MANKIEKKKQRLHNKIQELENELTESLTKKTSTTKEINVADQNEKIMVLRRKLWGLK